MFSVIIPLYNKAAYIEKAVQSVLAQSFKDFELLIVNDGSTDNSLEVVQNFDDPRIRIISQENAGVSTARNNGVKAAKHELIAFLDADDWWANEYLDEMLRLVEKYPDAGLWSARYYYVKYGQNRKAGIGLDHGFTDGYINYFKVYARTMWMPVYPPSVIITKKIFDEFTGFKTELKLGEDFHLWARIAFKYKIAYLNKPLVYYNQDVPAQERAIGGLKIRRPEEHYIFNLEVLKDAEKSNPELKFLLDKMRLRALLRYHMYKAYPAETKQILKQIDFSNHSPSWRLKYIMPAVFHKIIFRLKNAGSEIKSKIYHYAGS